MANDIEIFLPTFYPAQEEAYKLFQATRFLAVRCGRRWGKTDFGKILACDASIKGHPVGWFAPDYKIMSEAYSEIADTLRPILKSSSKVEGVMRTTTGGRIDFWTLENERAGRSRRYKLVVIDEAAFGKANMMEVWEKAIKPTLLDLGGKCVALSNANGVAPDNFLYQICNDPKYGFAQYHGPTSQNPHLPIREPGESDEAHQARRDAAMADLKAQNHPLVYRQEYLAEFVDWSGVAFFGRDSLLVNDLPVAAPTLCDAVFCTIDTAVKTGTEHDATAVTFWAISNHIGHRLTVLDWDIIQLEGSLLEVWLPTVFQRLEMLAKQCGARGGSLGAFIEDKVSGTILLQQAARRGMPAHPIDSKLTAVGKDERAISVSGYVFRGEVKISQFAYDKVTTFKGTTRNHWMTQVMGFRIGVKDQADDLLDTFTYGVAIALGGAEGY